MSTFRVQLNLVIDTLAHATIIKARIENRVSGKNIFLENSKESDVELFARDDGKISLGVGFRFLSVLDSDDFYDYALANMRTDLLVKDSILQGSRISSHICTHDDEIPGNCRENSYREFVK